MRRFLLASAAALPLLLIQPRHSDAIIVECANCADIISQTIELGTQAKQYVSDLATLQADLNMYATMLTQGLTLPMSVFAGVQSDIMQVRSITNAASMLTGNSGSILTRLQSAQGYANQAASLPQNFSAQAQMWQSTLGNASNALGRTLGVQQGQQSNYAALQAAIQVHSQSAAGQMQAIQAGNELASLTSTQLNQIQTTLTAATQQAATRDNIAAERQAVADAATMQFLSAPNAALTGYPSYK